MFFAFLKLVSKTPKLPQKSTNSTPGFFRLRSNHSDSNQNAPNKLQTNHERRKNNHRSINERQQEVGKESGREAATVFRHRQRLCGSQAFV
jgi:hypothetical protein